MTLCAMNVLKNENYKEKYKLNTFIHGMKHSKF